MAIPEPTANQIRSARGKPRAEWPTAFQVRWDFSPDNYHLAEDGGHPGDYPHGEYLIGEADVSEIDNKLHGHSRRAKSELWGISDDKVAGAILHWSSGGLMTPPLLDVVTGLLVITGGHNRLAVCRADDQKRLPFLYPAVKAAQFAALLNSFTPSLPLQIDAPAQSAENP